jgi:NADH-quinone oxidoreductase subunit L
VAFVLHALQGPAVYLAAAGVFVAWFVYMKKPELADTVAQRFAGIYRVLVNKYYADDFNQAVFAGGARGTGWALWKLGDVLLIDGLLVNGSARLVGWVSAKIRRIQTGYLYTYAFGMIIGLLLLLSWFLWLAPGK